MRTLDVSTAHVQRRADPFVDRQRLRAYGGADDIDYGIDSADLVKVDPVNRHIVNFCLSLAQRFEDSNRSCFRCAVDWCFPNDLANFAQAAGARMFFPVVVLFAWMFVSMIVRIGVR